MDDAGRDETGLCAFGGYGLRGHSGWGVSNWTVGFFEELCDAGKKLPSFLLVLSIFKFTLITHKFLQRKPEIPVIDLRKGYIYHILIRCKWKCRKKDSFSSPTQYNRNWYCRRIQIHLRLFRKYILKQKLKQKLKRVYLKQVPHAVNTGNYGVRCNTE